MDKNKTAEFVNNIARETVISVYSGRAHRCCCGCSGIHRYASAHRELGGKRRGYEISDSEVNDRHVTKVLRTLQANAEDCDEAYLGTDGKVQHVSLVKNDRLFVVYFGEPKAALDA